MVIYLTATKPSPSKRGAFISYLKVSNQHQLMTRFGGFFYANFSGETMSDKDIEQEIQAKGLTAPRVTPQRIQDVIASEHYFTGYHGALMSVGAEKWRNAQTFGGDPEGIPDALKLLTFCVLVLKNGFTVTGESACASPDNFDAEIGRKVARENAISKIWMLEGYLLKQQLHDNKYIQLPTS